MKYNNPHAKQNKDSQYTNHFADLGGLLLWEGREEIHFDLYALVPRNVTHLWQVQLGARFSNDGNDYISGCLDDSFTNSHPAIKEAAKRFVLLQVNK